MTGLPEQSSESPAEQQAWALLMAARSWFDQRQDREGRDGSLLSPEAGFVFRHQSQSVDRVASDRTDCHLRLTAQGWSHDERLSEETRHLLDLYLPVLGTSSQAGCVIGHLGQSVDARIATVGGDAFFVTGEENRKHLHRLRALCQAVVVGVGTITADDPQLTTRAVSGPSPVRVIIDPAARLPMNSQVLNDGQADTWLLHDSQVDVSELAVPPGCRRIPVTGSEGRLHPTSIVELLASRGIRRVFVEGGGQTVSRFFNARCLNRLQIAAAPVLVGEGVPSLQIPGAPSMLKALRPAYRLYRMGEDVMWDFELDEQLWNGADDETRQTETRQGPSLKLLWRGR